MSNTLPSIDEMMELASSNPEALEKIRVEAVEKLISSAPAAYQRRLRGLQWEIDCQRRLHSSPIGSCISISTMMLNSLTKLNDALHECFHHTPEKPAVRPERPEAASLLTFPRNMSEA